VKKTIGYLALACALTMTSACGKKATGQVVAVVNGEEISQQELNAEIRTLNVPASADKKLVAAQTLQRLIDRKLLVQKAKADGLDRTPEYLLQSRRVSDDLLIGLMSNKAGKQVSVPDQAAVNSYIASHPGIFSGRKRYQLDQIGFPMPRDLSVLKQLEPVHDWAGVERVLTAANIKYSKAQGTLDTATIPQEAAEKIAALPPGEPFVLPVNGGFVVSVIRSAEAVPTADAEARPAAVELVRRQQIESTMQGQLKAARAAAKIEYQPGFAPPAAKASGTAAK